MKNRILSYAPNLAGTSYVLGNILLLVSGGAVGNWWQLAAGICWLIDGTILGWFGRTVRGIEIHASINMLGCACMIIAATSLESPTAQIIFSVLLMSGSFLKFIAPSADEQLIRPKCPFAQMGYFLRRYPFQIVSIIALSSRPFILFSAIENAQWILFVAGMLWVLGDIFQFLSRKGGYIRP